MTADYDNLPGGADNRQFATTQWSVVLAAGDGDRPDAQNALADLCEIYWYPLYAYVRRRVASVEEAQDLTQAFFLHVLDKRVIERADRTRGRFRAFLLTAIKNFLANEWGKARAVKRGGGRQQLPLDFATGESRYQVEPAHNLTPERMYERQWVVTLLERVLQRLRLELDNAGKAQHFECFKQSLTNVAAAEYEQAAATLGITAAAAKQAAYRMRQRYRHLFREEVGRTVANQAEVDEEIARLLSTFAE